MTGYTIGVIISVSFWVGYACSIWLNSNNKGAK